MNQNLSSEEQKQRAYYDSIAATYDRHYANPNALRYRHAVYDRLLANVDLKGKRVLDAMCGGGEGSAYLIARGADVVGLDISPECCKLYEQRHPGTPVVCRSVLNTGFADEEFDFILTDSLHHLPPYLGKCLDELHRVLKPGGLLCCWEPNASSILNLARRVWYKADTAYFEDNEQAVDLDRLVAGQGGRFLLERSLYGGHLAYMLVNCSMAFRIPEKAVGVYAPTLIALERLSRYRMPKALSLWVLALLRKL